MTISSRANEELKATQSNGKRFRALNGRVRGGVRGKDPVDVALQGGKPRHRAEIVAQIRLFELAVDLSEVEAITRQEQAILPVDEGDAVGSMSGNVDDLELAITEIDHLTIC
jgi:hypothetical protein